MMFSILSSTMSTSFLNVSAIDFFTFGLVSLHAFSSILPPFATAKVAISERNDGSLDAKPEIRIFSSSCNFCSTAVAIAAFLTAECLS